MRGTEGSPILKSGLEIPTSMVVKKHKASPAACYGVLQGARLYQKSKVQEERCVRWCRGKPTNWRKSSNLRKFNMYRLNLVFDQRYTFFRKKTKFSSAFNFRHPSSDCSSFPLMFVTLGAKIKGRRPYPLCHAYRQMDDCWWVGQALGR